MSNKNHPMRQEGEFMEPKPRKLGFLDRFENEETRAWAMFALFAGTAIVLTVLFVGTCNTIDMLKLRDNESERIEVDMERTKILGVKARQAESNGDRVIILESD